MQAKLVWDSSFELTRAFRKAAGAAQAFLNREVKMFPFFLTSVPENRRTAVAAPENFAIFQRLKGIYQIVHTVP